MAKSIHPEMASLVLAIGACVVVSLLIVFCLLTVVTETVVVQSKHVDIKYIDGRFVEQYMVTTTNDVTERSVTYRIVAKNAKMILDRIENGKAYPMAIHWSDILDVYFDEIPNGNANE
jgi:uncharacterized protein YccT (UPF0319 family)